MKKVIAKINDHTPYIVSHPCRFFTIRQNLGNGYYIETPGGYGTRQAAQKAIDENKVRWGR